MKKIFYILITGFAFLAAGCNMNNSAEGWCVDNKSEQSIIVYFNEDTVTVAANTVADFGDISADASVTIDDSYHVNYDISYKYHTASSHTKLLTITDKTKYVYSIVNSTGADITFTWKEQDYTINTSSSTPFSITSYDEPISFVFIEGENQHNFTSILSNGIYHIEII